MILMFHNLLKATNKRILKFNPSANIKFLFYHFHILFLYPFGCERKCCNFHILFLYPFGCERKSCTFHILFLYPFRCERKSFTFLLPYMLLNGFWKKGW